MIDELLAKIATFPVENDEILISKYSLKEDSVWIVEYSNPTNCVALGEATGIYTTSAASLEDALSKMIQVLELAFKETE